MQSNLSLAIVGPSVVTYSADESANESAMDSDEIEALGVKQQAVGNEWWSFIDSEKFWKWLLIGGILLTVFTAFTSEFGLDTHLSFAEGEDGALVWGHTRPIDSQASDPNYAPTNDKWDFGLTPIVLGEFTIRAVTAVFTLGLIAFAGTSVAIMSKSENQKVVRMRTAALVAIYPTFIFSTGRAYEEPTIAFVIVMIVFLNSHLLAERSTAWKLFGAWASAQILLMVLQLKGIDIWFSVFFGLAILGYHLIDIYLPKLHDITRNPLRGGLLTSAFVAIAMLALGTTGGGGTLSVIAMDTPRFVTALLVSIFNIVVIYTLFGMMVWPFAGPIWKKLGQTNDMPATFIAITIAGFTTAITIYVAALWTYESIIWNADWPKVMWTMGNNGRYISLIMVPILMLLARLNHLYPNLPSLENPGKKNAALALGILLIIPISLLAGIHGQSYWTDDAGEYLAENMQDGEDFILVHDATLGMHYLYTFHTEIDLENSRNITGHWRAPDSGWQTELENGVKMENRGNLSNVQWVVFAPETNWTDGSPEGWTMRVLGTADSMNGGGDWIIWSAD